MELKIRLLFLVLAGVLSSCGSSSKTVATMEQSKLLEELVSQKSFEIQSDWALPFVTNSLVSISNAGLFPFGSSVNRISLIGNSNYLRVHGDSIAVYLPYYGERQMGAGYDNNGGAIQFNGLPEDYEVTQDEKTQGQKIRFKMKNRAETFSVAVTLFPNRNSSINVTSSHRFFIRYQGTVGAILNE